MVHLTKVLMWGLSEALPVAWNHCYSIFNSCNIIIIKTLIGNTKLPPGVDKYLVTFNTNTYAACKQCMTLFNECASLTPVGRQTCLLLRPAPLVCLAPCSVLVPLCLELHVRLHVQNCVHASVSRVCQFTSFSMSLSSHSMKAQ